MGDVEHFWLDRAVHVRGLWTVLGGGIRLLLLHALDTPLHVPTDPLYEAWLDCGPLHLTKQARSVITVATLRNLNASTTYSYRVGDEKGGWSDFYHFTTEPEVAPTPGRYELALDHWCMKPGLRISGRPIRVLSIGDEGATADSKEVFAAMLTADQKLHFDLLVHAGDIRYSGYEKRSLAFSDYRD